MKKIMTLIVLGMVCILGQAQELYISQLYTYKRDVEIDYKRDPAIKIVRRKDCILILSTKGDGKVQGIFKDEIQLPNGEGGELRMTGEFIKNGKTQPAKFRIMYYPEYEMTQFYLTIKQDETYMFVGYRDQQSILKRKWGVE